MEDATKKKKDDFSSFTERVKMGIQDEVAKRAMMQREIQMSINVAKARDTLQIFGSVWLVLTTSVAGAHLAKRPVPSFLMLPIVGGGLALCNMADLAYGNKLQRVMKEAEYIMENEKERFVPPKQVCPNNVDLTLFVSSSASCRSTRLLLRNSTRMRKRQRCLTKQPLLQTSFPAASSFLVANERLLQLTPSSSSCACNVIFLTK